MHDANREDSEYDRLLICISDVNATSHPVAVFRSMHKRATVHLGSHGAASHPRCHRHRELFGSLAVVSNCSRGHLLTRFVFLVSLLSLLAPADFLTILTLISASLRAQHSRLLCRKYCIAPECVATRPAR